MRPTSDRLRETLFNVVAPRIEGTSFLDLCAGSGAIGIEALSRGAAHVTFVDRSRKMCALVESNLDLCRVPEDQTLVVQSEAAAFLKRNYGSETQSWDIVFFDPPYASDYLSVLEILGNRSRSPLAEAGLLVVEHYHKKDFPEGVGKLVRTRTLLQGDSALSFYSWEAINS